MAYHLEIEALFAQPVWVRKRPRVSVRRNHAAEVTLTAIHFVTTAKLRAESKISAMNSTVNYRIDTP